MQQWLYRRLVEPLLAQLRQGIAPSSLALCARRDLLVVSNLDTGFRQSLRAHAQGPLPFRPRRLCGEFIMRH